MNVLAIGGFIWESGDIYRLCSVKTLFEISSKKLFILINKVPHLKVGNFTRGKVPRCPKRKLGRVKNNKHTHTLWVEGPKREREREWNYYGNGSRTVYI